MRTDLDLYIRPNSPFTLKKELVNYGDIELYTIEMSLDYPYIIERLRGYKWDIVPCVTVDSNAVKSITNNRLLNRLMEILAISSKDNHKVNTRVINVPEIENIICNNWPTVETYFKDLPSLRKGETNYWYFATSKAYTTFNPDVYVNSLREYTRNNAWHVSDITESGKNSLVYEFTNTYDDLYY